MKDPELAKIYSDAQNQSYAGAVEIDSAAIGDAHLSGLRSVYAAGMMRPLNPIAEEFEKRAVIAEKWGPSGEATARVFREMATKIRSGFFLTGS